MSCVVQNWFWLLIRSRYNYAMKLYSRLRQVHNWIIGPCNRIISRSVKRGSGWERTTVWLVERVLDRVFSFCYIEIRYKSAKAGLRDRAGSRADENNAGPKIVVNNSDSTGFNPVQPRAFVRGWKRDIIFGRIILNRAENNDFHREIGGKVSRAK